MAEKMTISPTPAQPAAPMPHLRRDYTYYKGVFSGRAMPFAYLDLDLLAQNVREIVARAAGGSAQAGTRVPPVPAAEGWEELQPPVAASGKRIRLASKSLRSVAVLRRLLAADPAIQGIMSYSAQEAAFLARQGFDDLLIGYPCWHELDIAAVAQATVAGSHITLMIDSVAHVEQIERVAHRYAVRLPLCLDLDMSLLVPGLHFGAWRSPIRTPEQARPIIERILQSQHVWLDGIMGYEAQIAGVGNHYPKQTLKNALVRFLQGRSVRDVAERRGAIFDLIKSYNLSLRFVNGGGTGSITSTREEPAVTEITVGSGFYAPALFDNYYNFRYRPAAGYAIEIVRRAAPTIYTCLGGGYVASGAAGRDKLPRPYLPEGARLDSLEAAGEVQTPIIYDGPERLAVGDPIFLRHSKAGELCERFTHLLLVSNGAIVDEVTTYRGDGQCFI
ncbi:MAG TPA: amino acid deaminase/aldolase [Ktedonobacterales bacterium]|nr:amino acid deaminase/aldolase [Ktedonobacterales bacterium]